MSIRAKLAPLVRPVLRKHPYFKKAIKSLDVYVDLLRHSTAAVLPQIIQPDPREIYVTLTANCNLRCIGCRYGRDFMPGAQLSWPLVRGLLTIAKRLAFAAFDCMGANHYSIKI